MSSPLDALIRELRLVPHPEGGAFREVFRSGRMVATRGGPRPAATAILFLLGDGGFSRWHAVAHREWWHLHDGDPLELAWTSADDGSIERRVLGRPCNAGNPLCVVPAGRWQTARS